MNRAATLCRASATSWTLRLAPLLVLTGLAPGGTVVMNDPNVRYGADGTNPCPRGDEHDDCLVLSYMRENVRDSTDPVFADAWNTWNNAQPADRRWTLVQGRQLNGVFSITLFNTFNNCPRPSGIEVRAYYIPEADDPTGLVWVQGLRTNRKADEIPAHDDAPYQPFSLMDVGTGRVPNEWPAPSYPVRYSDGRFYDKATAYCQHQYSVRWDATCLAANINYQTRTLTVYEGFSYGFNISCVHDTAPAPGAVALAGCASLVMSRRRRR